MPWTTKNCCNGLESIEKSERETSEQDAEIGEKSILRPVFLLHMDYADTYCAKLRDYNLSKGRTILVIYLHVSAEENEDGETTFFVGMYGSKVRDMMGPKHHKVIRGECR